MRRDPKIAWRSVAEHLAKAIPRDRFDPAVLRWLSDATPQRWHVALSGGADSVALLLLLWAHWPGRRRRLVALHFDHRLRGAAEARADLKFCRALCRALALSLVVGRWQRTGKDQGVSEAQAREARLTFFERHARVLWLGHHQDDVAETLLMRLARGSGAAGLSAPRPVQGMPKGRVRLRPLLGLRKNEIVTRLREAGATWREDATNAGPAYFRNRIRRNVLPAWEAAAERNAVAGAARSRELLAEDDAALEAWVDTLMVLGQKGELSLATLAAKPRAVVRRALHRWLAGQRPKVDISRQAFETLLDAVIKAKPTRQSLGAMQFAVLRKGHLVYDLGKPRAKFQRRVN